MMVYNTELLGFWTLSMSGILKTREHNVIEGALYKGPNRVAVFPSSPEDGNRSSF
jgi:hypothetical protein